MSHNNISGKYSDTTEEVVDSSVIKMDSSESVYSSITPKLTHTFSSRTIKLASSFPLDSPVAKIVKRIADILISLVFIIAIFPWLLPILALLIKLDSKGPVFFLQKRAGKRNRLFTCIKLRSMFVNAQADLKPACENDERITKIGYFLRKHYLDELPQFFNVLIGDMSVIGPRPHMISDNLKLEEKIDYYDFRHRIKPGITGLAQSLGLSGSMNNMKNAQNRIKLDIYYIRHWSPKLDFIILFRTIRKTIGF